MQSDNNIGLDYFEMMNRQKFNECDLDYSILERHKIMLKQLSVIGNSGLSVFDMFRQEHVFVSYNFDNLFGFDLNEAEKNGIDYFNSRVHPDDLVALMVNATKLWKVFYTLPAFERINYKLINEYRILNREEKYIRVIEQHQVLEQDLHGNIWLALSIIDISPNQENYSGIKSQLLNYKTGTIYPFLSGDEKKAKENLLNLTRREIEVLQLVKEGFLSKEISDRLSISIHTVNTHRQRILEKLGVNNSMEAVSYGTGIGILT